MTNQTELARLGLPEPDPNAQKHSQQVKKHLAELIKQQGQITFAQFMNECLYAPGLGYYSAGARKFGPAGDFVTAPEISPLFAKCLANHCAAVLSQLNQPSLIEFGAGTGSLAAELLLALEQQHSLPSQYIIIEISADLRARQQELLQARCPHLYDRFVWLNRLPDQPLQGIVIANEVLDAMPVHRFHLQHDEILEYYVGLQDNEFCWQLNPPSNSSLLNTIRDLQQNYLGDVNNYVSEINQMLEPWLHSISDFLTAGEILLIDYGFPAREYYHHDRCQGTLVCHYRHRVHANPFILPGLQDITAHVDFTDVAQQAHKLGFSIAGFTTQAAFLLDCGLLDIAQHASMKEQVAMNNQIKLLTLPSEMGEICKVMALTRNISIELPGFGQLDRRRQL